MKRETIQIEDKECIVHSSELPQFVLIQPVDGHDIEELSAEIDYIKQHFDKGFIHVAVPISKWNAELTPWPAPPVFGKIPFGNGARGTLHFIINQVIPGVKNRFCLLEGVPVVLGGYSLAGLFALWSAYQETPFAAVVAASPSAWYKDWLQYATENEPATQTVYLSLGDKEDKTKTQIMSTIKEDMLRLEDIFHEKGVDCVLEWNAGNHFQDNGMRTAKGFVWALGRLEE